MRIILGFDSRNLVALTWGVCRKNEHNTGSRSYKLKLGETKIKNNHFRKVTGKRKANAITPPTPCS